jgi:prefoldin subunit 5
MKDIHEVLRRKQAQYAQLAKQIELLQAAADKLREVAPLLSEADEDAPAMASNESGEEPKSIGAKASAASAPASAQPAAKAPSRSAPRWP